MLNIENYFKQEPFKMVLDDKLFVMDDSTPAFVKCLNETKELEKKIQNGEADEIDTITITLKHAFGEKKAKEIMNLEFNGRKIPMAAVMDICRQCMEHWQGAVANNTPSK